MEDMKSASGIDK